CLLTVYYFACVYRYSHRGVLHSFPTRRSSDLSAVRLMLEEQLAQSGTQLEVALESHQLVTVGRLVVNGLGGSAVPALCRRQMSRSEEHTSELQSRFDLVCRLLLEKKNTYVNTS